MSTASKPADVFTGSTSPVAPTPPPSATAKSEKEKLDGVQRELAGLRRQLNRATMLTGIIGAILLIAVCVYFYLVHKMISDVSKPETLVGAGKTLIDKRLPEIKAKLEGEIIANAPTWASGLSKLGQDKLKEPATRTKLEQYVMDQMEGRLKEVKLMTKEKFELFVENQRPKLQKNFDELSKNPAAADAVLNEFVTMLESEFEVNMRHESAEMLRTLKDMNVGWKALKSGKDLDDDSRLERRVWQLGRRLYLQETAPQELIKFDRTQALPWTKREAPNTAIAALIDAVNAEQKTLTVTIRELNKDVAKSFKLGEDFKVAAAGNPKVKLADLTKGTPVLLQLSADGQTVQTVVIRPEKGSVKTKEQQE